MSESKQIYRESSPEQAAVRATDIFKTIVRESVAQRQVCHLALSGGTTPRSMYHHLADHALGDNVPWSRVEVYFGDERDVPQDDVESNFGMAQRVLLDHAPIDWSRVHAMRADAEDIEAASREYEATLRHLVPAGPDGVPQLDLVMLGMGGDGHVASLFPHTDILGESHRLVAACHVPVLGRNRMTFTFPLINAARNILLLVTGDDKAEVVERVFKHSDQNLPAARVNPRHGTLHVVLDVGAARLV
ncbi:MAG: 6-phosphogluconolactonase [Phycisphaerae bacterium]|nr:6-phosphogluconolactonase [Phycisphaerae bacterium]